MHLFPWRVAAILLIALGLASFLFWFSYNRWEGDLTPAKAVFAVLNMTFFQLTYADMPADSRLDIFPIIIPLIGLPLFSLFGLRVIRVLRIFFLRGERGQEWQEAVVHATIKNHILICGLGRVGYRVARQLLDESDQLLVGIEAIPSPLVAELIAADLPVIFGDAEQDEVLQKAGLARAQTIIVCTDNDLANLDIAFKAREMNPRGRIVMRLFEDDIVEDIKASLKVEAIISRSAVAAISFFYAAIGGEVIETFQLGERAYVLAKIPLTESSAVVGRTVGEVAEEQDVTIMCYNRGSTMTIEPDPALILQPGDNLFIFTTLARMMELIEYGLKQGRLADGDRPVLVCGLGHTGYRVVTNLLEVGRRVIALDFEETRLSGRLRELGVPLEFGDLRWKSTLVQAGLEQAAAIIVCTEDDMVNLQVSLRARALKPNLRIVTRIFDDKLARHLRQVFGISAVFSTSALASPDFVSAALNRMNVRLIDIEGLEQAIVRLQVTLSALYDLPVVELQQEEGLTVLLHAREGQVNIPPDQRTRLRVGDEIVVLAAPHKLDDLNRRNKTLRELHQEGYERN